VKAGTGEGVKAGPEEDMKCSRTGCVKVRTGGGVKTGTGEGAKMLRDRRRCDRCDQIMSTIKVEPGNTKSRW